MNSSVETLMRNLISITSVSRGGSSGKGLRFAGSAFAGLLLFSPDCKARFAPDGEKTALPRQKVGRARRARPTFEQTLFLLSVTARFKP